MAHRNGVDDERGGLLAELTTGFEALMKKADELVAANDQLAERLSALHAEVQKPYTPNKTSPTGSAAEEDPEKGSWDWRQDKRIQAGIQAWKLLKIATVPAVPLRGTRQHLSPDVDEDRQRRSKLSVPAASPMEKDFTTTGPKGDLRCPFSTKGAVTCGDKQATTEANIPTVQIGSSDYALKSPDPIAREFHAGSTSQQDPSVDGSAIKCPIRYIDQHSPEEVAKYVEEHKHEIPRSHEVCIKRYQANEASIRSLDAKYGSLVKMIQGLGQKHKPMLPANANAEDEMMDPQSDDKSMEKVQEWANNLPDGEVPSAHPDMQSEHASEERTGHFDRPLQEVRLGESPSRPWGIRVPLPYTERAAVTEEIPQPVKRSQPSTAAQPTNAPVHENDKPKATGKCPFSHGMPDLGPAPAPKNDAPRSNVSVPAAARSVSEAAWPHKNSHEQSRIVFTGPVFFGYSAEDAAALMSVLPRMTDPSRPT